MPTATRPPATFEPAPRLDAKAIEAVLRVEGYRRYPVASGFFWDNGSGTVFSSHENSLEFYFINHPTKLPGRSRRIDWPIEVIAPLISAQFIAGLRDEAHAYAGRVDTPSAT